MVKNIVSKEFNNVYISPSIGTIIICHVCMTILQYIPVYIYIYIYLSVLLLLMSQRSNISLQKGNIFESLQGSIVESENIFPRVWDDIG